MFMTGTLDRGLAESRDAGMAPPGLRARAGRGQVAGRRSKERGTRRSWAASTRRRKPSRPWRSRCSATRHPRTTAPDRPDNTTRAARPRKRAGLRIRGMFADIKAISLAFFDTYLRNEAEGRTALEGAAGRGGVELVKK